MVSPTRSFSHLALTAVLSLAATAQAFPARAQEEPLSLIRDTEIEEILKNDSAPLYRGAGLEAKSIHILLIGSKDLNAFASPGTMAVFTGLILESKSTNQLQGVMAHEIGHLAGGQRAAPEQVERVNATRYDAQRRNGAGCDLWVQGQLSEKKTRKFEGSDF